MNIHREMNKRVRFIFLLISSLMPLAVVAQQTHWTPQGSAYEDNMTLTGVIQINGVEQQSANLEVGAFCGTECRGAVRAVLFPATQRYVVMLTIFGNDGDQITFRLYDHNQGMELNYQSPAAVTFGSNSLGSLMNPYVLNFTSVMYTISASANPSTGGTVSGAGSYPQGANCTLTATANTGYTFVRWTRNGTQVSTSPTYSFTVTQSASYVAIFEMENTIVFADPNVKAICLANWDNNGSGELSFAEAAAVTSLGVVFKGDTTITSFEELQYFTGLSAISANAFRNCSNLTGTLYIPNSVTSIGDYAFSNCGFTGSLTIPNSVTTIASYAFQNCSGLNSITLPNSVTSIRNYAFQNCSGLNALYYTGVIAQWCRIAFSNEDSNPLSYAHNLYINNELVTELVIPNTATSIRYYAFSGGSCLTSVIIPNSVTIIYNGAFRGCSNMTSVTIGNSVTSIGNFAFGLCSSLTSVYYTGNIAQWCGITFGDEVFGFNSNPLYYAHNLYIDNELVTELFIPDSVNAINQYAFNGGSCLTSVIIGNSVTSIGSFAFGACTRLTSVTIGHSVTSIVDYAFSNCSSIAELNVLPETPPTIGNHSFSDRIFSRSINVPCASIASYQAAAGWSEFTNYHGIDCPSYVISVTAYPAEGGTVSGAGTYEEGTICTLTATSAEDYIFVNWTENGEVVSTEETYSFTVTGTRELVANFILANPIIPTNGMIAYYPFNGNANDASGYSNHGILQGNAPQLTSDRFGNENSAYLFGGYYNKGWIRVPNSSSLALDDAMSISFWVNFTDFGGQNGYGSYTTNNSVHAVVCKGGDNYSHPGFNACFSPRGDSLMVWSFNRYPDFYYVDTYYQGYEPGQWLHCVITVGNTLAQLYINGVLCQQSTYENADFSNANNQDMTIGVMNAGSWYPFNGKIDDVILYNRALSSQEVAMLYNFVEENVTQTIELSTGWTWMTPTVHTSIEAIEASLGSNLQFIQSKDGTPSGNSVPGEMYRIQTTAPCTLTLTGTPIATAMVTINPGENWIGFVGTEKTITTAFADFTPATGDKVISQDEGFTIFNGTEWEGTLDTLVPGKGYVYVSNDTTPKTLVIGE